MLVTIIAMFVSIIAMLVCIISMFVSIMLVSMIAMLVSIIAMLVSIIAMLVSIISMFVSMIAIAVLTAMSYHFYPQPLPTAKVRRRMQGLILSALFMEVALPVCSFLCRSESAACWVAGSHIVLQTSIAAAGHLGSSGRSSSTHNITSLNHI